MTGLRAGSTGHIEGQSSAWRMGHGPCCFNINEIVLVLEWEGASDCIRQGASPGNIELVEHLKSP